MKKLLITLFTLLKCCQPAMAQEPVFTTYFDTTYWFSNELDPIEAPEADVFTLDTMAGNRYGKYSQFALKYAQSIYGTKVGDGLCGRVGEGMREKSHSKMNLKGRITTDLSILEVGDIIVFPQFLEFADGTSTPGQHLVMFMGMKNDSTMLLIEQNATGGPTAFTHVTSREVYLKGTKFFKGNTKGVPYFDVYGYSPRKALKSEYSFLSGKK
jgi:hypothetical protein